MSIEVDGKAQSLTVIALKDEAPEVLLGTDHEVTRELLNPKPIGPKCEVFSQVEVCAITRAKSPAQKKEWAKDMVADTRDGAEPNESFTSLVDPIPDKPANSRPIPYQFTDGNGYREVKEVVVAPIPVLGVRKEQGLRRKRDLRTRKRMRWKKTLRLK